jgi:hypothetical protein
MDGLLSRLGTSPFPQDPILAHKETLFALTRISTVKVHPAHKKNMECAARDVRKKIEHVGDSKKIQII